MSYLGRVVLLIGAAAIAYIYATAEVPGGEKRYEQVIRQFADRHPMAGN